MLISKIIDDICIQGPKDADVPCTRQIYDIFFPVDDAADKTSRLRCLHRFIYQKELSVYLGALTSQGKYTAVGYISDKFPAISPTYDIKQVMSRLNAVDPSSLETDTDAIKGSVAALINITDDTGEPVVRIGAFLVLLILTLANSQGYFYTVPDIGSAGGEG